MSGDGRIDGLDLAILAAKYGSVAGDSVYETYADIDDLESDISYRPETPIEKGIANFVDWYRDYYKVA